MESPPRDDIELYLATALRIGRRGAEVLKTHTAAVLAFSGVALYLIGLIRTVGILEAEDIPVTRGLPLAPLQDYLLRGLAVIATPQAVVLFVVIIPMLGLVLLPFLAGEAEQRDAGAERGIRDGELETKVSKAADPFRRGLQWFSQTVLPVIAWVSGAALLLLMPVALWLPVVPGLAGAAFAFSKLEKSHNGDSRGAGKTHTGLYGAGIVLSLLVALAMYGYFYPPPLDVAKITTKDGATRSASLLLTTGPALYVVGRKADDSLHRNVEAIPWEAVGEVEISDGEPRDFRTLPELFGIRFWRYEEDRSGGFDLERSPPGQTPFWEED